MPHLHPLALAAALLLTHASAKAQGVAAAPAASAPAAGERRAKELILSARAFSAAEGVAWGIVNRVCEPAKLVEEALETGAAIAANGPLAVRQAKKSIHYGLGMDLASGYRFEIEAYNRLVDTDDRREGVRAFVEKRKAVFKGS